MRKAILALVVVMLAASAARLFEPAGSAEGGEHETSQTAPRLADAAVALPAPARPAFTVGRPQLLDRSEEQTRFAAVIRTVNALTMPRWGARPLVTLEPHTDEGTSNIVVVVGEAKRQGTTWLRVRLPILPNGRVGWVPRDALGGFQFVRTRLVVDREQLRATLFAGGEAVFEAPIGIGTAQAPTPSGEFYVRLKLAGFDDPFYGPVAFGTNARSTVLTDWPGGGYIGIHGTNAPELLPGRVSHGCVRMRNQDIVRLARLMPVGTPITIR